MSKRKKIIITTFLMALIVIGLTLIFKQRPQKEVAQREAPQPTIPQQFKEELSVETSLEKKNFNFPSNLPLLTVSFTSISKEEAVKIASSLNFEGEPLSATDVREGVKYIWSNQVFFLVVTPQTRTIKYGLNNLITPVLDKNLSDAELIEISVDFLSKNSFISKDDIKFTSIAFLKEDPQTEGFREVERKDADIFQLNFSYKVSDYEILSVIPSEPLVLTQIQTDGSVFKAQVTRLGEVAQTKEVYPLKDFNDVTDSLDQAVLVDVIGVYLNLADLSKGDIKDVVVEQVRLAYLLDTPNARILTPIFILEGKAKISGYPDEVKAVFYLPATKNPQP